MEKSIYDAPSDGIYFNGAFQEFMRRFKGATRITWSNHEVDGLFQDYYHIEPNGVTLSWIARRVEQTWQTKVTLYGDEKQIQEVERKITEGSEKIQSAEREIATAKRSLEELTV